MSSILCWIGGDEILVYGAWGERCVARQQCEWELGPLLVSLHQEHDYQKVYVVNGPGSFSNVRLGSLLINTLAWLNCGAIALFSCDKLAFFGAFVDAGLLPARGVIFIGQKKNAWLYDFEAQTQELVTKAALIADQELFLDATQEWASEPHTVRVSLDGTDVCCAWKNVIQNLTLDELPWVAVDTVPADYMIAPSVGTRKASI